MKLKYLLITRCEEQGYWDTSGHCHWSIPAFYNTEQFDLDQSDSLVKSLAEFIEKYPPGEYEIYVIKPYREYNYDDDEWEVEKESHDKILDIECEAIALSKKIAEQKKIEEKEKLKKRMIIDAEQEKQRELKLLAQLKAKHESERD